jgi:hypothetical protein
MRTLERTELRPETGAESAAAAHLAEVARALAAMGDVATAISSTQRVGPAEAELIARLLPSLASRYGLNASIRREGESLTVRFERKVS